MNIVNASKISKPKMTALLYGAPGVGKTTTLRYLPGKTLVVDVDRTSFVLNGAPNIDIVYVDTTDTWKDWGNILTDLVEHYKGKYDNICLDNISELERCILAALGKDGKNNGVPAQADYQYMQFRLMNSLRYMKQLDANIIWTAWETTDQFTTPEGQIFNRAYPQINAKILNPVCGLCNVVGRMVVKGDGTRGFIFVPSNGLYAKNQYDERKGCAQDALIETGAPRAEVRRVANDVPEPPTAPPEQSDTPLGPPDEAPVCDVCELEIAPTAKRTVEQLVEASRKATGYQLCANCSKRWKSGHDAHADVVNQIKENMTPEQWQSCITKWGHDERDVYMVDDAEYGRLLAILFT